MKKKFVPVLTVLLAVIMAAAMVACGDGAKDKYTVYAQFNSEYGTVTVTDADGASKTDFAAGENAVITVTPKEGYEVVSFTVNLAAATLTDGKYTFAVSANTTVVVGFGAKQPQAEYTVSVSEYDTECGTVKVAGDDGTEKSTFTAGENAVVTATPKEGYGLASLKVNGKTVTLTNGKYIFAVSANTTVAAEFAKTQSYDLSKALAAVAVSFKAEGIARYMEDGEDPSTNTILTIFDEGVIYNLEKDAATGEIYYEALYVDRDGKLAVPSITVNNELEYVESDSDFADFDNPLTDLGVEDFTACETAGEFVMADSEKARSAATAITGWNESISEFKVIVSYDNIVRIEITTERIAVSGEDDLYYTTLYVFAVSDWGTAEVDMTGYVPFEHTDEHTALAQALAKAAQANNYKLHIDEPATADEEAVEYDFYVTETAIYSDCENWENGYVEIDGMVYPFDYDPETEIVTASDPLGGFDGIADMRATFSGFAPELFEYKGDGVYELRSESFISAVLAELSDGYDNIMLAYYAYGTLKITLKDGDLYSIEYDYYVYGMDIHRIITYGDFDETELPISLDNIEFTSVLDAYVGTYTDGEHTAVISADDGVVVDGEPYEISYYENVDGALIFVGEWKGEIFYMERLSKKQIVLYQYDEDAEEITLIYTLTSTALDPVEIPDEFVGVWTSEESKVVISSGSVYINEYTLTVLSYDEDEGLTAMHGAVTYNFYPYEGTLYVFVIVDGKTSIYAFEKDEDGVVIPDLFIGTFEGEDTYMNKSYKATISQVGISVTVNGTTQTATLKSIEEEESWGGTVLSMYVLIDDKEYVFAEGYGDGQLNFGSVFDSYASVSVTLNRVDEGDDPAPDGDIPEKFFGKFESEDKEYLMTISADGITLSVSGVEQEVTIVEYSDYEDFTLLIGGVECYLMNYGYGEVEKVMLFDDEDLEVTLFRVTEGGDEPAPSKTIPEIMHGTFEGEDSYVHLTCKVVIAEDSVEVYFNGVKQDNVVVVSAGEEYDDYYHETNYVLNITVDGKAYEMSTTNGNSLYILSSFDSGNTIQCSLARATEGGDEPPAGDATIPEKFYGDYMDADETYYIEIDKDGIYVMMNDEVYEATIVAYNPYEGFTLTLDGETYYLSNAEYTDGVNKIAFMSEDYRTVKVVLDRVED